MDFIKINSDRLKIILSPYDIEKLGLNNDSTDYEDTLSMKSMREILETARAQTGFDSGESRLYIQFFPSKDGGGEMYIVKKQRTEYIFNKKHFGESADIQDDSTYIAVFSSLENVLELCKRLKSDNFTGESSLYIYEKKYIMILCGKSFSNHYTYLSEYAVCSVADSIKLAFIEEHTSIICKNTTVETFCEKFGLTI